MLVKFLQKLIQFVSVRFISFQVVLYCKNMGLGCFMTLM